MALSLGIGMNVVQAMMEQEMDSIVGAKGKHNPDRDWYRHGCEGTSVILAGQKARIKKPRARKKDDSAEYDLDILKLFQNEDPLNHSILKHMIMGVSTRKYQPLQQQAEGILTYGVAKSSVSERFIEATQTGMEAFLSRQLTDPYPVIMIDGVSFGAYLVLVALGIRATGEKQVLGLQEGSTENAHVCGSLLDNLMERGLDPEVNRLFVLDGAKALSKAVRTRFQDKVEVQRCQLHKKRNVESHLPESMHSWVKQQMNLAYAEFEYDVAKRRLTKIAEELEYRYPSASASILEGLEETLTLHRLKVPGALRISLSTTNPAESLISILRSFAGRVTNWESGNQVMRWLSCGSEAIESSLRRIKGYKLLPLLAQALREGKSVQELSVVE